MAENVPPGTAPSSSKATATSNDERGLPYYEKLRRDLRDILAKKQRLDKNLVSQHLQAPQPQPVFLWSPLHLADQSDLQATLEDAIHRHETIYLEETSTAGNIIKGFDNYIKSSSTTTTAPTGTGSGTISGSAAGGSSRRRGAVNEIDRVFSRSSSSYHNNNNDDDSAVTTPATAAGTPTGSSGGAGNKVGGGTTKDSKKKKGSSAAAAAAAAKGNNDDEAEDSGAGAEGKPNKRQKITYGRD